MPLKPIVDDINSVNENFRSEYVPEKGPDGAETGRHLLAVEQVDGYELANTRNLRSALDSERNNAKQAQSELKRFEGIDPDEYRRTSEELEQLKQENPDREKQVDELVEKRVASFKETSQQQIENVKREAQGEVEKLHGENKSLQDKLNHVLVNQRAEALAAKVSDHVEFLAPKIARSLKADYETGEPQTLFVNADGSPRYAKDDFNKPMSEAEFLQEIVNDPANAALIRGPENSGPNTSPSKMNFGGSATQYDPKASKADRFAAVKARVQSQRGG